MRTHFKRNLLFAIYISLAYCLPVGYVLVNSFAQYVEIAQCSRKGMSWGVLFFIILPIAIVRNIYRQFPNEFSKQLELVIIQLVNIILLVVTSQDTSSALMLSGVVTICGYVWFAIIQDTIHNKAMLKHTTALHVLTSSPYTVFMVLLPLTLMYLFVFIFIYMAPYTTDEAVQQLAYNAPAAITMYLFPVVVLSSMVTFLHGLLPKQSSNKLV